MNSDHENSFFYPLFVTSIYPIYPILTKQEKRRESLTLALHLTRQPSPKSKTPTHPHTPPQP